MVIQWRNDRWKTEFDDADVLVFTPDVFRYILDRAYVRMKDLNVIVFDEAHHTRGSHAYKVIMSVHYATSPPSERPKIFGMTASPLFAKENVELSIK